MHTTYFYPSFELFFFHSPILCERKPKIIETNFEGGIIFLRGKSRERHARGNRDVFVVMSSQTHSRRERTNGNEPVITGKGESRLPARFVFPPFVLPLRARTSPAFKREVIRANFPPLSRPSVATSQLVHYSHLATTVFNNLMALMRYIISPLFPSPPPSSTLS